MNVLNAKLSSARRSAVSVQVNFVHRGALDKHTVRERGSSGRHADVGGHEKGVLSKVLRMTQHG